MDQMGVTVYEAQLVQPAVLAEQPE